MYSIFTTVKVTRFDHVKGGTTRPELLLGTVESRKIMMTKRFSPKNGKGPCEFI